jgi:flavin-dependent dehydrogenase
VERFPALAARLEGVNALSRLRGAGPLERAARARTADRFALVGDAAGYVDAITGEGISLSLLSALALGRVLPDVVAQDGRRAALAPYERDFDRLFRSYAMFTRAVLALARAERVRRAALVLLRRFPRLFDAILALGIGS